MRAAGGSFECRGAEYADTGNAGEPLAKSVEDLASNFFRMEISSRNPDRVRNNEKGADAQCVGTNRFGDSEVQLPKRRERAFY
jgi:hypothetical protein